MNLYIASKNSVYITDGLVEELVDTFDSYDIAEKVCKLLNATYKEAYQDGMNASLREKHGELIDKVTSLTIQIMKLNHEK